MIFLRKACANRELNSVGMNRTKVFYILHQQYCRFRRNQYDNEIIQSQENTKFTWAQVKARDCYTMLDR
jgi:hypothetical protein